MKFVTENELRDLYRKEPFASYTPGPDVRLTPGARQFLADRGIDLHSIPRKEQKAEADSLPAKYDWRCKLVCAKLRSAEALFLQTGQTLIERDILAAQRLAGLEQQLRALRRMAEEGASVEDLPLVECIGIRQENFSEEQDDCFAVTSFHLQTRQGREILELHLLRCALREIVPVVMQVAEAGAADSAPDVAKKLNQILNTLSQMICKAAGGKECQRTV